MMSAPNKVFQPIVLASLRSARPPAEHRRWAAQMRALCLALLPLSIAYANGVSLSAVDIEGIQNAAAEFAKGPLSRIDAKSDCDLTADEENCSAQAAITVETASGPQLLTVSRIDGLWKIGRWQREIIAFQKCAAAAKSKEDRKACYGPTGKYGGVRKK